MRPIRTVTVHVADVPDYSPVAGAAPCRETRARLLPSCLASKLMLRARYWRCVCAGWGAGPCGPGVCVRGLVWGGAGNHALRCVVTCRGATRLASRYGDRIAYRNSSCDAGTGGPVYLPTLPPQPHSCWGRRCRAPPEATVRLLCSSSTPVDIERVERPFNRLTPSRPFPSNKRDAVHHHFWAVTSAGSGVPG